MPFLLALTGSMAISAHFFAAPRPAATTSTSLVDLMGLSHANGHLTPNFVLTDQHGRQVSIGDFRGKAVLLAFMDSRCTEVCPLLAQMFVGAEHDLGSLNSRVAFVAVNVNAMAASVSAVEHFSRTQGLASLPNWYFLTGSATHLQAVWTAYGIQVIVPKHANQTVHADPLYFVDRSGHVQYVASPQVGIAQGPTGHAYMPRDVLAQWGQGIATYLRRLLAK
jgi:cytochrome oxidase Cu insertion factor (SCO1/SenC/PrrC family)